MMARKGDITLRILEKVGEASIEMAALFAATMLAPYGSSAGRIQRKQEEIENLVRKGFDLVQERRRFSKLICKMKREGLIVAEGRQLNYLTKKGVTARDRLRQRRVTRLPDVRAYQKEKDDSFKVIIFDVPEKERRKRDWLRASLDHLGFYKLQKSVWAGKKGVPKDFMKDLRELKLIPYVEVFEVGKAGSLEKII